MWKVTIEHDGDITKRCHHDFSLALVNAIEDAADRPVPLEFAMLAATLTELPSLVDEQQQDAIWEMLKSFFKERSLPFSFTDEFPEMAEALSGTS